ncbi:hypothetical protein [Posidoniimonas polymericola]|nr:hypothetical protein [Posidoniimonas polymericola]
MSHTPPPWRFRFSLLNLLLFATVVVMGLVIVRLAPLREEVRRLRQEAGVLNIDDPTKIQAIQRPRRFNSDWTWRIYLPPGGHYGVAVQVNELPESGVSPLPIFPNADTSHGFDHQILATGLSPGEWLITLSTWQRPSGDAAYGLSIKPSASSSSSMKAAPRSGEHTVSAEIHATPDQWPLDKDGRLLSLGTEVQATSVEREPGDQLVLLNRRFVHSENLANGVKSYSMPDTPPTDGVALWIVSKPPEE